MQNMYSRVCTACTDRAVCTVCTVQYVQNVQYLQYVQIAKYLQYVQYSLHVQYGRCVQCIYTYVHMYVSTRVCTSTYVRRYLVPIVPMIPIVPGTWYAWVCMHMHAYACVCMRMHSYTSVMHPCTPICLHTPHLRFRAPVLNKQFRKTTTRKH